MYRVYKDKRVEASARKIIEGLRKCLKKKAYNDISVSDIAQEAGVSRATFYRLFDTPTDILEYSCDSFAENIVQEYKAADIKSKSDSGKFILEHWMAHADVIEAIMKSGRIGLLVRSMESNMNDITPGAREEMTESELDYVKAAIFAQLGAMLMTWARHGKTESADTILNIYRKINIK